MTDFGGQRVLVTGAGGFLGANLCRRLLDEGAHVHAIVRTEGPQWRLEEIRSAIELHVVDITDAERLRLCLAAIEPRTVVHLAMAAGHPFTAAERANALQVSLGGTHNLLAALTPLSETRLVHLGSWLEYGSNPASPAETSALEPGTFRGAIKAGASLLCHQFAMEHDRDVVILRPFSVYGPWEPGRRFIPAALLAAMENRELPLTKEGHRHDFVFVADVVEACLRAAELRETRAEVLNVGSGREWTNEEVVELIREVLQLPLRTRSGAYPSRAVDHEHRRADMRKTERILGWRPTTDLPAGLALTAEWLREHGHSYEAS